MNNVIAKPIALLVLGMFSIAGVQAEAQGSVHFGRILSRSNERHACTTKGEINFSYNLPQNFFDAPGTNEIQEAPAAAFPFEMNEPVQQEEKQEQTKVLLAEF